MGANVLSAPLGNATINPNLNALPVLLPVNIGPVVSASLVQGTLLRTTVRRKLVIPVGTLIPPFLD